MQKITKKPLALMMTLCMLILLVMPAAAVTTAVNRDATKATDLPRISGKYFAAEIADAIESRNARSAKESVILNDVLLPTSMGIEIPNIDPENVYQTVDVYTLDPSFSKELSDHGIYRTSMSYSEYDAIESTWVLPKDMCESIQNAYPELNLVDISSWTYGDYKNFCKERDYNNLVDSISPEQMQELNERDILVSDLHHLIKEYHTIDGILDQSNESIKQTLEVAYQLTANRVGINSNLLRATPPSDKYTYVYFPRYNGGAGDYFLNSVLTTTYWQGVQADRALKTQQVLYNSTSTTLCCTNMYGTYSYSQGGAHEGLDFVDPGQTNTPTIYAVFEGVKQTTSATHHLAVYDSNAPDEAKTYSYLHMSSISAGTNVSVYDAVGKQGNNGNATGYHVHFEVHSGKTTTLSAGNDHTLGSISPYRLQDYIGELG